MLMNTCAIRENAHNKVYGHLAELRPSRRSVPLVVGVFGCMAQNLKEELTEKQPLVDVLVGPDATGNCRPVGKGPHHGRRTVDSPWVGGGPVGVRNYDDILPERDGGVNAWIAIMRGCDNFCSFCVVPYTWARTFTQSPRGSCAKWKPRWHPAIPKSRCSDKM